MLADRRGLGRGLGASRGQPGGGVFTDGDRGFERRLHRAAVDGVFFGAAHGSSVGDLDHGGRSGCSRDLDDGRRRARRGRRYRGSDLGERGGVDLAGGNRVDPVLCVDLGGLGGRARQSDPRHGAGGADADGREQRRHGRRNAKLGAHG